MSSTIIIVAEFRQGVKGDFVDVFADYRACGPEHLQARLLKLHAGSGADIADNDAVDPFPLKRPHRLAGAVGMVRFRIGQNRCLSALGVNQEKHRRRAEMAVYPALQTVVLFDGKTYSHNLYLRLLCAYAHNRSGWRVCQGDNGDFVPSNG
jgi:hypothetical protein